MMPILIKSDDVRSGRKAGYGQHRSQWANQYVVSENIQITAKERDQ